MVVVLLFNSYATRSGKGEIFLLKIYVIRIAKGRIFLEKYRRGKNQKSVCGTTNYRAVEKNRSLFWFLIPPGYTIPTKPVGYNNNKKYQ